MATSEEKSAFVQNDLHLGGPGSGSGAPNDLTDTHPGVKTTKDRPEASELIPGSSSSDALNKMESSSPAQSQTSTPRIKTVTIPPELFRLVLEHVAQFREPDVDLARVARTSRSLQSEAERLLYRNIDVEDNSERARCIYLILESRAGPYVRSLTIRQFGGSIDGSWHHSRSPRTAFPPFHRLTKIHTLSIQTLSETLPVYSNDRTMFKRLQDLPEDRLTKFETDLGLRTVQMNFLVRQSKSITHLKLPLMHPQDWGGQEFFQDPLFLPNIRVLETNGGTIEKIFQGRDIKVLRFIRGLGSLPVILKGFRLYGENLTALHLWSINGMALQPLRAMLGATPNLRLLGSIDCTPKYRASTPDSELLDILGTLRYLEAIEFFTPRWPLQQPWRDFVSLILSGKQLSRLRFAYIVGWGPQICTIRPTNAREWAFTEEDSSQVTPHEQWDSLVAEIIGSASP